MRVRVNSGGGVSDAKLRSLLYLMLGSTVEEIAEVRIELHPIDDAVGGGLVRCRVNLKLCDGETVSTEEVQRNTYLAMSRALDRSLRTVRLRQSVA